MGLRDDHKAALCCRCCCGEIGGLPAPEGRGGIATPAPAPRRAPPSRSAAPWRPPRSAPRPARSSSAPAPPRPQRSTCGIGGVNSGTSACSQKRPQLVCQAGLRTPSEIEGNNPSRGTTPRHRKRGGRGSKPARPGPARSQDPPPEMQPVDAALHLLLQHPNRALHLVPQRQLPDGEQLGRLRHLQPEQLRRNGRVPPLRPTRRRAGPGALGRPGPPARLRLF